MSPLYCHLYESNLVYNSTLPTPLTSNEYSLESIQLSCLQILHLSILFFATVSRKVKSPSVTSLLMAPLHSPHAPDPSMHYGWNRLQIKSNFSCVLQVLCLPGKTVWNIRIWQIYSSFIWIIVTRCFFYMKTDKR